MTMMIKKRAYVSDGGDDHLLETTTKRPRTTATFTKIPAIDDGSDRPHLLQCMWEGTEDPLPMDIYGMICDYLITSDYLLPELSNTLLAFRSEAKRQLETTKKEHQNNTTINPLIQQQHNAIRKLKKKIRVLKETLEDLRENLDEKREELRDTLTENIKQTQTTIMTSALDTYVDRYQIFLKMAVMAELPQAALRWMIQYADLDEAFVKIRYRCIFDNDATPLLPGSCCCTRESEWFPTESLTNITHIQFIVSLSSRSNAVHPFRISLDTGCFCPHESGRELCPHELQKEKKSVLKPITHRYHRLFPRIRDTDTYHNDPAFGRLQCPNGIYGLEWRYPYIMQVFTQAMTLAKLSPYVATILEDRIFYRFVCWILYEVNRNNNKKDRVSVIREWIRSEFTPQLPASDKESDHDDTDDDELSDNDDDNDDDDHNSSG